MWERGEHLTGEWRRDVWEGEQWRVMRGTVYGSDVNICKIQNYDLYYCD